MKYNNIMHGWVQNIYVGCECKHDNVFTKNINGTTKISHMHQISVAAFSSSHREHRSQSGLEISLWCLGCLRFLQSFFQKNVSSWVFHLLLTFAYTFVSFLLWSNNEQMVLLGGFVQSEVQYIPCNYTRICIRPSNRPLQCGRHNRRCPFK